MGQEDHKRKQIAFLRISRKRTKKVQRNKMIMKKSFAKFDISFIFWSFCNDFAAKRFD